jgi:hypothetical protein
LIHNQWFEEKKKNQTTFNEITVSFFHEKASFFMGLKLPKLQFLSFQLFLPENQM